MAEELVVDLELGLLRWDSKAEWWEGEIRLSSETPFTLYVTTDESEPSPLTDRARDAIARIRGCEETCRGFAADELLALHNSEWSEGVTISRAEFMARLSPDTVEVHWNGYAEVHFEDGDLFRGQSVGIRIRPDGSFQEVVVEG